ncbi:MAG: 30S ribosomal protein S3 [Tannerella sp.]|nr:30S ribosomal protein S3 [Tannerella sp.]
MGQKVNPISNRLGIIRGWDSNWYGGKKYGATLLEDSNIRKYLNARLAKASISRIVIERTLKLITITVCTSRPGLIIGKAGSEVDKLKEELKKITDKDVQINIFEVKRPELDAVIVANNIARQLEGKIAYRRAIKSAIAATMRIGAEGIKVQVSGRLNGAEMARSEMYKEGRTPLHTFRADIDYALGEALTKVGLLGIKVWICRGEIYGKRDLAPSFQAQKDFKVNERGERVDGDKPYGKRRRADRDDRGGGGERGDRGGNRGGGGGGGRGNDRGGNRGGGGGRGGDRGGNRGGSGSGGGGDRRRS